MGGWQDVGLVKFFRKAKDGGPQSTVTGYWLAEIKSLFSIALLKFEDGSRDEFHSHAFNSLNWVLGGKVSEQHIDGSVVEHTAGLVPVVTTRDTFHRVVSRGTTWVLSLRGPWHATWFEFDPKTHKYSETDARTKGGRVTDDDVRTVAQVLIDRELDRHPWPWTADYDWSAEIKDATGQLVISVPNVLYSDAIMRLAKERHLDRLVDAADMQEFLRENGIDS